MQLSKIQLISMIKCSWSGLLVTLTQFAASELQKKLGVEHLNKAYNYLKRARFDDRRHGTDVDEKTILHDLSRMVPSADDRFKVEQLLFLEMQLGNWAVEADVEGDLSALLYCDSRSLFRENNHFHHWPVINFHNSFAGRFSGKFAIKLSLRVPTTPSMRRCTTS